MKLIVEQINNLGRVFSFIGNHINYELPFVPNLPLWAQIWDGKIEDWQLLVCSSYNDNQTENPELIGVCVRSIYKGNIDQVLKMNSNFNPLIHLGDFGNVDKLVPFCDELTEKMSKK